MTISDKNLSIDAFGNVAEVADGTGEAERAEMERLLAAKRLELDSFAGSDPMDRARLQLDAAELLNSLARKEEA